MTDAVSQAPEEPAKSGKASMILGLVLALAGAGGGYYAVHAGYFPPGAHGPEHPPTEHAPPPDSLPDIAFVAVDPIVITLGYPQAVQHLRFRAQLEVEAAHESDVALLMPRVVDVLNGYLRALEISELRDPLALTRLRAQMLRRVQIVTGKGRVRDLLIMDFVLN
ncbi:flagellar basal body-associated FliL family protein [Arenibacterium sp. CAU 1754]